MPQSPVNHQLPPAARPLTHPTVWQQLPEPQRQQCYDRMAQWLTARAHGAQSEEPSHA
jgi:hypothetical protein